MLTDMVLAPSVAGLFKWRQFEPEVILLAVGWYLRFSLSYRDVEELLAERGLRADHLSVWSWVQIYAPEMEPRWTDLLPAIRGKIKPAGYADDEIVIQQWDEILRMIATIKLKEVTASDLFRRLNSYSKQHALYRALKAFGQVPKSLFILQVTDDPVLRQAIEKQMDRIAHVHRFRRPAPGGNPARALQ